MDNLKKIENLLALILIKELKDSSLETKAKMLNIVGFSHSEIAIFLETTPSVIRQSVYMAKKVKKSKKVSK